MIRKDLNRIKAINFLKDSDPTLGKFLSFFEEKQFYIQNDYNKKSKPELLVLRHVLEHQSYQNNFL